MSRFCQSQANIFCLNILGTNICVCDKQTPNYVIKSFLENVVWLKKFSVYFWLYLPKLLKFRINLIWKPWKIVCVRDKLHQILRHFGCKWRFGNIVEQYSCCLLLFLFPSFLMICSSLFDSQFLSLTTNSMAFFYSNKVVYIFVPHLV